MTKKKQKAWFVDWLSESITQNPKDRWADDVGFPTREAAWAYVLKEQKRENELLQRDWMERLYGQHLPIIESLKTEFEDECRRSYQYLLRARMEYVQDLAYHARVYTDQVKDAVEFMQEDHEAWVDEIRDYAASFRGVPKTTQGRPKVK